MTVKLVSLARFTKTVAAVASLSGALSLGACEVEIGKDAKSTKPSDAATRDASAPSGGGATVSPDGGATDGATAASATLTWRPCDNGMECATLAVPVDHSKPEAGTANLALNRRRARDPGKRIGAIVVNPGGPGGSGIEFATWFSVLAPANLLDRFDVVGFDPRGVGMSTPVVCDGLTAATASLEQTPETPEEESALVSALKSAYASCTKTGAEYVQHIGTMDVVRDLEAIRVALGEPKLRYLGVSYGTSIGARYAVTFPDKYASIVVDSNVDPDETDRWPLALAQATGREEAFQSLIASCDKNPACPTMGRAAAAYDAVLAKAEANPIPAGKELLSSADVETAASAALYSEQSWPAFSAGLAAAEKGDGSTLKRVADNFNGKKPDGTYDNSGDLNFIVQCLDAAERPTLDDIHKHLPEFEKAAPHWGRYTAYAQLACLGFPVVRPLAPVTPVKGPGVLVIGSAKDPATPLAWSEKMAAALGVGRLLTFGGQSHGAVLHSRCVDRAVTDYFATGALPAAGASCAAIDPVTDYAGSPAPKRSAESRCAVGTLEGGTRVAVSPRAVSLIEGYDETKVTAEQLPDFVVDVLKELGPLPAQVAALGRDTLAPYAVAAGGLASAIGTVYHEGVHLLQLVARSDGGGLCLPTSATAGFLVPLRNGFAQANVKDAVLAESAVFRQPNNIAVTTNMARIYLDEASGGSGGFESILAELSAYALEIELESAIFAAAKPGALGAEETAINAGAAYARLHHVVAYLRAARGNAGAWSQLRTSEGREAVAGHFKLLASLFKMSDDPERATWKELVFSDANMQLVGEFTDGAVKPTDRPQR